MIYKIENEYLVVRANTLSAELTSLYSQKLKREFLWQPGNDIFQNQAKNLFPNVGMVCMDRVFIEGKEYAATQHGFAKDSEFELVEYNDTKMKFSLCSSEMTKKYLPYDFVFSVVFELENDSLKQSYVVDNLSENEMFFGVGAHTGFYCPISLGEKAEDYELFFGERSLIEIMRDPVYSLRTGETKLWELSSGAINLSDSFFDDGAKIFTGFKNNKVRLRSKKSGLFVDVSFEGFPYCTLWSRAGRLCYICIEPWCGLPDSADTDHVFETKEGNVRLKSKEVFERVQIFRCGVEDFER